MAKGTVRPIAGALAAALTIIPRTGAAFAQLSVEAPPDPYVHRDTGFAFPASVGSFVRGAVTEYDADASDVGVNYEVVENGRSVAIATVYVFPLEHGENEAAKCRQSFDEAKQAITDRFDGAETIAPDALTDHGEGADKPAGHHIAYRFTADLFGAPAPIRSDLHLYCPKGTGWQVKYRMSTAAGSRHERDMQSFMRSLAWPAKLGA